MFMWWISGFEKKVNLIEKKALLLCKSMIEYMYNERGDQNGKFKRTY